MARITRRVTHPLPSRTRAARDRDPDDARLRLDVFLPYCLSILTAKMQAHLARHYRQGVGLDLPEARVMAVLGYHRPVSSNAIVQHTTMDKATVSRAVARLMRRGLVTRKADPTDRRLLVLDFTAKGERAYRGLAGLARGWETWLTDAMPRAARTQLTRDLRLLIERLDTAPQPNLAGEVSASRSRAATSRRGR